MISCFFSFVIAIARPKTAGLIKADLGKISLLSKEPNLVDPCPDYNPPVASSKVFPRPCAIFKLDGGDGGVSSRGPGVCNLFGK